MKQIIMMDKIEEFNESVEALWVLANNWLLRRALLAEPRNVWAVGDKLELLANTEPHLTTEEIIALLNHIKQGDSLASVSEATVLKIEVVEEARRLVMLYAEIHDVEQRDATSFRWPRNSIDTITV